jgi:hypothetical protein
MKFRKKPVEIEAEQFLPNEGKIPAGVISDGNGDPRKDSQFSWVVKTLEGNFRTDKGDFQFVSNGDWIITGIHGERYPCKPDVFEATYEAVT